MPNMTSEYDIAGGYEERVIADAVQRPLTETASTSEYDLRPAACSGTVTLATPSSSGGSFPSGGGEAASPGNSSAARTFTKRQMQGIIKDQDLLSDIQSILAGQAPSPAVSKPASAAPAPAAAKPPENEHAIFDRIAQNMRYANAYNLGEVQLAERFDEFDKAEVRPERTAKTKAPPIKSRAVQLGTEEVLGDLDSIRSGSSGRWARSASDPRLNNPDWPARPSNLRTCTSAERTARFGSFEHEADPSRFGGDGIRILGDWQKDNIIAVPIPQLAGKLFGGRPLTNLTIQFHRAGQQSLIDLWRAWEQAGLLDRIVSFQGGFAPRYIRGTQDRNPRPLSQHAWGTAFDINAEWNGFGSVPALLGQTGCVRELVEIANQHGFFWGGHFRRSQDGMHFELGQNI